MALRQFQERRQGGQVASFAQATPSAGAFTDLSPISAVLGDWAARQDQEREQRAVRAQQVAATEAQLDAPEGTMAQPGDGLARRFQETFREQARGLYLKQLDLDARTTASQLALEHQNNPDAFRDSFSAYAESLVTTAREQDVEAAAALRQGVTELAVVTHGQLVEQKFQRDQKAQRDRARVLFQQDVVARADELVENPSQERMLMYAQDLMGEMEAMVDVGFVSEAEALEMTQNARNQLTWNYLWGEFNYSVRRNDPAGAQGIIDNLLMKRDWFTDYQQAQQLAGAMQSRFRSSFQAPDMGPYVAQRLTLLERARDAAFDGEDIDFDQMRMLIQEAAPHATRSQLQTLRDISTAVDVAIPAQRLIDQSTLDELESIETVVGQYWADLRPEDRRRVQTQARNRREEIQTALADADPLAAFELPIGTATPDDVLERHARASHTVGRPLTDFFSRGEVRDLESRLEAATSEGDTEEMLRLQELFTAPIGAAGPRAQFGHALKAGNNAGQLVLHSLLRSAGMVNDIQQFNHILATGARIDPQDVRERIGVDAADVVLDSEVQRRVAAMTAGNEAMRSQVNRALEDYAAGWAQQQDVQGMSSRREVRRELRRLLGPFDDTYRLANGATVPKMYLGEGGESVVRQVNEALRDPTSVGIPANMTESIRSIVPMPLPDGRIGLFNSALGQFVPRANSNQPITFGAEDQPPPTSGLRLSAIVERVSQWAGAAKEMYDDMTKAAQATTVRRAAQDTGVDPALLEGMFWTVEKFDMEDPQDVIGPLAVPTDIRQRVQLPAAPDRREQRLDLLDAGRTGRGTDDPTRPEGNARYAAAYMSKLIGQYGDDRRALAAYYGGEELVDEALLEFGDSWFDEIPVSVRQYVIRVEAERARLTR